MAQAERHLRADAERNRKRLLEAAAALFSERGLDVGVEEIIKRAGVGRGTLFRNFPAKEDLIAAIVAQRMREAAAFGRGLLGADDPGAALSELVDHMAGEQQAGRALFEAVEDTFLANPEIRAAHAEFMAVVEEVLGRAQDAGAVRADVGAFDLLLMFKGVCEAANALSHVDPQIRQRHLDLMLAALSPAGAERPLRGQAPTLQDLERAFGSQEAGRPKRAAG